MRVSVVVQVSSSPASLQLLSILQTLLVLGPDRSNIWLALESITNRAALLAQDCESDHKSNNTLLSGHDFEEFNGQIMASSVTHV